jgi:hypothetical protein
MPITINGSGTVTGLSVGGLPDGSINNADLATDAVSTSKLLNGAVTTAKLGSAEASGLCKAWVNFNGTGVVAIRASYNVSSITDNGTGDYTVNFTTALADANYCSFRQVSGYTRHNGANGAGSVKLLTSIGSMATTSELATTSITRTNPIVSVEIFRWIGIDHLYVSVAIFR